MLPKVDETESSGVGGDGGEAKTTTAAEKTSAKDNGGGMMRRRSKKMSWSEGKLGENSDFESNGGKDDDEEQEEEEEAEKEENQNQDSSADEAADGGESKSTVSSATTVVADLGRRFEDSNFLTAYDLFKEDVDESKRRLMPTRPRHIQSAVAGLIDSYCKLRNRSKYWDFVCRSPGGHRV